ncbi:extracellular solute-binding protein [Spiroplasma endosymbiont of Crioceris asparagi]|uniref:extracellular solute-binding protein n=1 Tax=Spiroplasma endosymbiont of Crioceris asparagi TaxID=3066286 RepID=UPI0030D55C0B
MKKFIRSSYLAIILLALYLPIAIMMFYSFNSKDGSEYTFNSFSFYWYDNLIKNSPFLKSITTSLFVAITSTIISIVIGVMAVIGLSKISPKKSRRYYAIANIPLVNADIITAVSLMVVFIIMGIKFGILTLIASHVSFNVPYVIITVMPFLKRIDKNIIAASEDLGSTQRQTIFKVILPSLLPSIITAAAICFSMSFDDFIISYFNGGDQTNVSTFIYTAKKIEPYINAFGTLLVSSIFAIIILFNIYKSIVNKKAAEKNQLKNNEYKIKKINKFEKKIAYYQGIIDYKTFTKKTKNIFLLIKYRYLFLCLKINQIRNYDSKISKLEWKKEVLNKKIKNQILLQEKYQNAIFKKEDLLKQLDSLDSKSKIEKINSIIEKLNKKIKHWEYEIEWQKEHESYVLKKVTDIQNTIDEFKDELAQVENKKEKQWYLNHIEKLEVRKFEIIEGKSKVKLKKTIAKLALLKQAQSKKIQNVYAKLSVIKNLVFVSFLIKDDKKTKIITKAKNKVIKLQAKIADINNKKEKLYIKYYPDYINVEGHEINVNKWRFKNLKVFMVIILFGTSFIILAVTYALNNVYDIVIGNWGSYIRMSLVTDFEKKYNVKVNYQQYDSNEILYNKNITYNYDVMVPSDYMVKKMAEESYLQPIDWNKITIGGKKGTDGVNKTLLSQLNKTKIDRDKITKDLLPVNSQTSELTLKDYCAPYFWGDVRVVFNMQHKNVVKFLKDNDIKYNAKTGAITNQQKLSWDILWRAADNNLNLCLNDDDKNLFMYALEKDFQIATPGKKYENGEFKDFGDASDQITKATSDLINLIKGRKNVGLYTDDLMTKVQLGDFDVATLYNGDSVSATDDYMNAHKNWDSSIAPFVQGSPQRNGETTNAWTDNMVISKNAKNTDLCYKFISFIYEQNTQDQLVDETGYLVPTYAENKTYFDNFLNDWYKPIPEQNAVPFQMLSKELEKQLVDSYNKIRMQK